MNENAERSKAVKSIVLDGNYRYAYINADHFAWGSEGTSEGVEYNEDANIEQSYAAKYEVHSVINKRDIGHMTLRFWHRDTNEEPIVWWVEVTSTTGHTFQFELEECKARLLYIELYRWLYNSQPHIAAMTGDIDLDILN